MSNTTSSIDTRIVIQQDKLGGEPHIANRRIRVRDIVQWYDLLNQSADEIAAMYELELVDIFAALAYYHLHRKELQEIWSKDDEFIEKLRQEIPSKVKLRLHG